MVIFQLALLVYRRVMVCCMGRCLAFLGHVDPPAGFSPGTRVDLAAGRFGPVDLEVGTPRTQDDQ